MTQKADQVLRYLAEQIPAWQVPCPDGAHRALSIIKISDIASLEMCKCRACEEHRAECPGYTVGIRQPDGTVRGVHLEDLALIDYGTIRDVMAESAPETPEELLAAALLALARGMGYPE